MFCPLALRGMQPWVTVHSLALLCDGQSVSHALSLNFLSCKMGLMVPVSRGHCEQHSLMRGGEHWEFSWKFPHASRQQVLSCDLIGPPVRLLRPRQEQFLSPYLRVDVCKQIPNLSPLSCPWGSPEVQGPVLGSRAGARLARDMDVVTWEQDSGG